LSRRCKSYYLCPAFCWFKRLPQTIRLRFYFRRIWWREIPDYHICNTSNGECNL